MNYIIDTNVLQDIYDEDFMDARDPLFAEKLNLLNVLLAKDCVHIIDSVNKEYSTGKKDAEDFEKRERFKQIIETNSSKNKSHHEFFLSDCYPYIYSHGESLLKARNFPSKHHPALSIKDTDVELIAYAIHHKLPQSIILTNEKLVGGTDPRDLSAGSLFKIPRMILTSQEKYELTKDHLDYNGKPIRSLDRLKNIIEGHIDH